LKIIDLRSDTVTLPTKEMLESILDAELGDDGREGDPTAKRLERIAAETQTRPGDEIIVEEEAHINYYEAGGLSSVGGLMPRPIRGELGALNPRLVEKMITEGTPRSTRIRLICIENTHNRAGGTCTSPSQIEELREIADRYDLNIHMDGARIFNAAVALKVDVKELAEDVDTLMFCLSKGLSAPVGSLVVGSHDFIEAVRGWRKILGGTLRQAGIIAAPGILALEKMVGRLEEDHENARRLAEGLVEIRGIEIDMKTVQTNIVKLDVGGLGCTDREFTAELEKEGVGASAYGGTTVRMVTHRGIERSDIDTAIDAARAVGERLAQ